MRTHVLLLVVLLPVTAMAQSAFMNAQDKRPTDDSAIRSCNNAAEMELRSHAMGAGNVDAVDPQVSHASESRTDVSGKGRLNDGVGPGRDFTYRCSYDTVRGTTSGVMVNLGQ